MDELYSNDYIKYCVEVLKGQKMLIYFSHYTKRFYEDVFSNILHTKSPEAFLAFLNFLACSD